jgi:hypothetical protein
LSRAPDATCQKAGLTAGLFLFRVCERLWGKAALIKLGNIVCSALAIGRVCLSRKI